MRSFRLLVAIWVFQILPGSSSAQGYDRDDHDWGYRESGRVNFRDNYPRSMEGDGNWNFDPGQCTWFVAWLVPESQMPVSRVPGGRNANEWYGKAPSDRKDGEPRAGSIMCFDGTIGEGAGHVAVVLSVHPSDVVVVDANWSPDHVRTHRVSRNHPALQGYIHRDTLPVPIVGREGPPVFREHQGIIDAYNRGGTSRVGNPTAHSPNTDVYVHPYGSGWKQDFGGGSAGDGAIFQRHFNGPLDQSPAFWLHGKLWAKYGAIGGAGGSFGWPTGDQTGATSPYGTQGDYGGFNGGQILWPKSGPGGTDEAYPLWGKILDVYRTIGGIGGSFGFPHLSHVDATSRFGTAGQYSAFEGGQILWPIDGPGRTGDAYALWGGILSTYRAIDGVGGGFGYPQVGHVGATSRFGTCGEYAAFEGGQILWPRTGPGGTGEAYAIYGDILNRYRQTGGIGTGIGFPGTGHVSAISPFSTAGQYAAFEGGQIQSSERWGTWLVEEPILARNRALGGIAGVGYPKNEAYSQGANLRQDFEGGPIVIDRTPPDTTITSQPADPSGDPQPTFEFGGVDDIDTSAQLRFKWRIDQGNWSETNQRAATVGALTLGKHTFEVAAVDSSGNADQSPAVFTWQVTEYSIEATPPAVDIGGTVSVNWFAPAGRPSTDWISLFREGDPNTAYGWWRYTQGSRSGTLTVNVPLQPGRYVFRYLLENGFTSVAQSNVVTVNQSVYAVTASTTAVAPGGALSVSWTAPAGRPSTDWISLYRVGDPNRSYGWWQYTNGAQTGMFALTAPLISGEYEFRYLLENGYTSVANSEKIVVHSAEYTLTASSSSVGAGGSLSVSWTAPSGTPFNDWVGIFKVGDPNTAYGWWRYTNGALSGTFSLSAPMTAGQYEFRYLLENGFTDVARSNPITVQ